MLTLYHSPFSRSTRIVQLVHELDAEDQVEIRKVDVIRFDGSGRRDPANPHPEGKVPVLVHDGVEIWESTAIAMYLAELFPDAGLNVPVGDPLRGRFLSWMAWYGDVIEPLVVLTVLGIDHPELPRTFRSLQEMADRLHAALRAGPYLMGQRYTVADLILASTFGWKRELLPDDPLIRDWADRCLSRPAAQLAQAEDMQARAA